MSAQHLGIILLKIYLGYELYFQRILNCYVFVWQGGSSDCEPRAHGSADAADGSEEQGEGREDRPGAGKEEEDLGGRELRRDFKNEFVSLIAFRFLFAAETRVRLRHRPQPAAIRTAVGGEGEGVHQVGAGREKGQGTGFNQFNF